MKGGGGGWPQWQQSVVVVYDISVLNKNEEPNEKNKVGKKVGKIN